MTEEEYNNLRMGDRVYSHECESYGTVIFRWSLSGFGVELESAVGHDCGNEHGYPHVKPGHGYNLWEDDLDKWDVIPPSLQEQLKTLWEGALK